jgi:uncharacterized membrane protein (DUF373 family)
MPEPKVPTAYSNLRILIEITSYLSIAGLAIFPLLSLRFAEFSMLFFFALGKFVVSILSVLVVKGLAHALLDIADAQRERK